MLTLFGERSLFRFKGQNNFEDGNNTVNGQTWETMVERTPFLVWTYKMAMVVYRYRVSSSNGKNFDTFHRPSRKCLQCNLLDFAGRNLLLSGLFVLKYAFLLHNIPALQAWNVNLLKNAKNNRIETNDRL